MSSWRAAFREYGLSQYALKEAAVASSVVRQSFDLTARVAAAGMGVRGRLFDRARIVCQAVRLLEGHEVSPALARLHAGVLAQAGVRSGQPNAVRASYLASPLATRDRKYFLQYGADYAVRMKVPRLPEDPCRQGNLVVLKAYDREHGEKGVLYLQYTESIRRLVSLFDLHALAQYYRLVVEPSTWGYQDESFLLLIESGFDVIVQAQDGIDHDYLSGLQSNLIPIRLGAGDWIDPHNFTPAEVVKDFDFVMVASWSAVKRHSVFFDALAKAELFDARVALVGYPWEGRTSQDIETLAARSRLSHVQIFERITRAEVAAVIRRSRVGVMLTRREGANRGIYECLFCGVPIVVAAGNRGVNKALINEATGRLATDGTLPNVLREMLEASSQFRPREWASANTGCENAWRALNDALRDIAGQRNEEYKFPIARIKSAPAAIYVCDEDRLRLGSEYENLTRFLRPANDRRS